MPLRSHIYEEGEVGAKLQGIIMDLDRIWVIRLQKNHSIIPLDPLTILK